MSGSVSIDLFVSGECIGSVVRSGGVVFAYDPAGRAVGQFADLDAAAAALSRLRATA